MKRLFVPTLLLVAGSAHAQTDTTAPLPLTSPSATSEAPAATDAPVAPATADVEAPPMAIPAPEAAAPTEAAPAPSATPPAAVVDTFGELPADKGRVVFFRPGTFVGMAIPCNVHEFEGVDVAKLGSGKYFVHVTDPGAHSYKVRSEVTDKLPMEVEAGETYFVSCTIGMGVMVGRPNLSPSDRATFDLKAKGMKLWVPKPAKAAKTAS